MKGETNLSVLLRNMEPVLNPGKYVYCHVNSTAGLDLDSLVAVFKEKEAVSVIVSKEWADKKKWQYYTVCRWITLNVHSSLQAVGLTAAFSNALSSAGIGCNVVAAYYHDHIFVAEKDAAAALSVLKKLVAESQ